MSAVFQQHLPIEKQNPNLFNDLNGGPWFILKDRHERVQYRYDSISEFFGENESGYDGLGLAFESEHFYEPGSELNIGIPLPDSVRNFKAVVVSSENVGNLHSTGIWLRIESEVDLLTLLRSSDYLNIRQTS